MASAFCCAFPNDLHRHPCDPANDFRLNRVVEPTHLLARIRMGNHNQLPSIDLAPTAHVPVTQLGKVYRPLKFGLPPSRTYPFVCFASICTKDPGRIKGYKV